MATFNSSTNILNNFVKSTEALQSTAALFAPPQSSMIGLNSSRFSASSNASAFGNHSYIGAEKNLPSLTQHVNSLSSYTFMEIKREPCQVSEVTTSNSPQSINQPNAKSMSSTMTTMVKMESTSPKISEMEKVGTQINTNVSVPVGIAMVRKKPQDTIVHSTAIQTSKDMNYFGISVADLDGVATAGCGNIYFAGADLISGVSAEDVSASTHNGTRSSSTFWQYPNTFPLESVISMSPVGLQYSRDSSRGQLVLLPTTAAMDSFQQAFLWPPYMQQTSAGALQSPPNFIFPSINPQINAQSQSFAPIQLLGSNYLTAAAAAATSTLFQHSQTNGSRFASVSSDMKRIEQSQKQSSMKIEGANTDHNFLNKGNFTSHHAATGKIEKSIMDCDSNYLEIQPNESLGEPIPVSHEHPHVLLHNTAPSSEFNIPVFSSSFITRTDTTSTPSQITQVIDRAFKNPALKTPEMQDVNIQTDTPVCSEDENSSLEVSTAETITCNMQSAERYKSISNLTSAQCHNNYGGCRALLKESVGESLQVHAASNDYSADNTYFAMSETSPFEREIKSNRTPSKDEFFNSDSPIIFQSTDGSQNATLKATNPPLFEMSGLELLSNISTGAFVTNNSLKTVFVKQEPCEDFKNEHGSEFSNNYENYRANTNTYYPRSTDENEMHSTIQPSAQTSEQSLGGLNLLCALAEQRIQEEVESINYTNAMEEQKSEIKRRKHKHSKIKSKKQLRCLKKNNRKYVKERKEYLKASGFKCEDVHENLRSAFRKVDSNYKKLCKWPNPEDFFSAMESDMRLRLADITRQYRKKKKKLDEISKIKKRKKSSSSEYKFANISCKNPNFICFLDKFQPTSSNFPSTVEATERQQIIPKKNFSECTTEISENNKDKTSGKGVYNLKFDTRTPLHDSALVENIRCKEGKDKKKRRLISEFGRKAAGSRTLTSESQPKATIIQVEKKVVMDIDKDLVLTNEHLYQKETRVLTDMGGLFYAGILKPLQPPDVYAITLDGERGNKSHIMSREEIFKDTILEVAPTKIENVPTGTRLCAYWSQQYRCLYPGKAIDSEASDIGSDFVSVEFDDGDSGRINLQNIRFLLSDYPIVEYSENPFNTLGKNKRSRSTKSVPSDMVPSTKRREEMRVPLIEESRYKSLIHKIDKKKNKYNQSVSSMNNLTECTRKHRKHKKRKKHKKNHRNKSFPKISTAVPNIDHKEENMPTQEKEQTNFKCNETNKKQLTENNVDSEAGAYTELTKRNVSTLLDENVESQIIGLDDDVSETSDEVIKPNEKVDYTSGKGSKIAAFLPERQLWSWLGRAYRKAGSKGRARKQFYKSITRGKETITVGECAVFLSTGRPDRPYIGRIEALWETTSSNKVVRVRWFYHPEETTGCPILKYPGALFDSPHEDENDVQTISHRCEVVEFSVYIAKFGQDIRQYQSIYDNNDTYYLSGYYNPRLQVLKLQPDIPTE